MSKSEQKRNSSIELLRIILMIMIIGSHFAGHGGFIFDSSITFTKLWWNFTNLGGNLGVDVFVIISGYYLITNDSFKSNIKKALKLWGQIFFYSVVIFFVMSAIEKRDYNLIEILHAFFPVIYSQWWFASTYFVLYLIHPFINKFLLSLNKKQYQIFLLSIILLWCLIPMFTNSTNQSNPLIEFIVYYSIAGYIRLFTLYNSFTSKNWLIIFLTTSLLLFLSSIVIMIVGVKYTTFSDSTLYFYRRNSILTIIQSISLFMTFININIKNNKIINKIASTTFGVFLIHDHYLIRPILWVDIFKNVSYQNTFLIIPYSILVTIIVFVICSIIDLIRQYTIEKAYLKIIDKSIKNIENKISVFMDFITKIIFR